MAFGAFFNASFTKPAMQQLMAVIQRDSQAALDLVASPGTYQGFLEYGFAYYPPSQPPALLMVPRSDRFTRPDSVQSRPQTLSIEITVYLANQDKNLLALQQQDYIRAIDIIISSLGAQVNPGTTPNFNDFYSVLPLVVPFPQAPTKSVINTMTAGCQAGSVLACYVLSHNYPDLQRPSNNWEAAPSMEIRIDTNEI